MPLLESSTLTTLVGGGAIAGWNNVNAPIPLKGVGF